MIFLKPLTIEDSEHFYNLYKDPKVNHGHDVFLPGEKPLQFTTRIIAACVEIYTIRLMTEEETLIGDCALHDPDYQQAEIEIGGSLLPAFQGKGYMREAFALLESRALNLQMQRLIAKTGEENQAAILLVKKLGYTRRSEEKGIITFSKLLTLTTNET